MSEEFHEFIMYNVLDTKRNLTEILRNVFYIIDERLTNLENQNNRNNDCCGKYRNKSFYSPEGPEKGRAEYRYCPECGSSLCPSKS